MKRRLAISLGLAIVLGGCNSVLGISEAETVTDDLSTDAGTAPAAPTTATPLGASLTRSTTTTKDAGAACGPCELPFATPTCADGACAILKCDDGHADCNGDPSDGCEVDTSTPDNCGECGNVCSDTEPVCDQGACVPDPGQ